MDPMDELRQTYFLECEDLLEELDDGLTALSDGVEDPEIVNGIFRAVHSIKGGGGVFGLDDLVRFAHRYETLLDDLRSERIALSEELSKTLFTSADLLRDLIDAARSGTEVDAARIDALMTELQGHHADPTEAEADPGEGFEFDAVPMDLGDLLGGGGPSEEEEKNNDIEGETADWHLSLKPNSALSERGSDASVLLRELRDLGATEVRCDSDRLPEWGALGTGELFLQWTIVLPGDVEEEAIREVFEFFEDECVYELERSKGAADRALPDLVASVGPSVVPIEEKAAEKKTEAQRVKPQPVEVRQSIRVDLDRVDRLINLIGELVINQAILTQGVYDSGVSTTAALSDSLDDLKRLTRDIQDSVMAIRAQPVKSLFKRMARTVREAANATGKSVRFVTEGEQTEIDKTIIERLGDPLTHMIRNAVDHGLETPDERLQSGKSKEGTVRLCALHRSGRVIIEVADDGAGINREKVKSKAIDRGLIDPLGDLSPSDIDNLLFLPGFSTADQVSNLSGRGVGMDVVKRSIQSLGGRIHVSSDPGSGSVFTISLPLTLAVMEGMIVNVAGQTLVVPLADIVETMTLEEARVNQLADGEWVALVRGECIPLISVADQLNLKSNVNPMSAPIVLLTETEGADRSALLIDGIVDQRQVVIKGLEENYGHVPGIAAATILGDGNIALIVNVSAVARKEVRLSAHKIAS